METLFILAGLLAIGATVDSSDNIKNNLSQSTMCKVSKQCILENSNLSKDSPMSYILKQEINKTGK
jgi:hypothetical protein